nr:MAG TPA: hypothetical protein [Caudoviricetes sp.]
MYIFHIDKIRWSRVVLVNIVVNYWIVWILFFN